MQNVECKTSTGEMSTDKNVDKKDVDNQNVECKMSTKEMSTDTNVDK
jgi:hypothetical protein